MEEEIRETIRRALLEDHVTEDSTSTACVSPSFLGKAHIVLKEQALVAGLPFIPWVFHAIDPSVQVTLHAEEGKSYPARQKLATIEGPAHALLAGERCALNLLQHASGIATTTRAYVDAVEGCACEILDTRKTIPGIRTIQKYAVKVGGGKNHRQNLKAAILIKNNHLALLKRESSQPIREAILRTRKKFPGMVIEVEAHDLDEFQEALAAKADRILLDNMDVEMVKKAVDLADQKVYLEASGGIDLTKVKQYAMTGVNGISIGKLTHSAQAVDIHMKID